MVMGDLEKQVYDDIVSQTTVEVKTVREMIDLYWKERLENQGSILDFEPFDVIY